MHITKTEEATSLFSTASLIKQVASYLQELEDITSQKKLSTYILEDFKALTNYFIAIGDQQDASNKNVHTTSQGEVYLIHFTLAETFKDLVLLHRDVALQLQISQYKDQENSASSEAVTTHFKKSKDVLIQSVQSFAKSIEVQRAELNISEKSAKKIFNSIKHRNNPWEIYKSQFQIAQKQLANISLSSGVMTKTIKVFEDIKNHNNAFLNSVTDETNELRVYLGEGIRLLKEMQQADEIPTVVQWIDKATIVKNTATNLQQDYMVTIELKTKMLSEITLPVATENGQLLTRKVNFNKDVKRWVDFEILPSLIDLVEHSQKAHSFFNHSLINLKTGLLVEKNNNSVEALQSQLATLKNVHATITKNADHLDSLVAEIQTKFHTYFQATKVYTAIDFLEVSFQSSLAQFASEQTTMFSGLKAQFKNRFAKLNSKYESSLRFQSQDTVETAAACIHYRMFKEENAQYDTLFLNKSFVGDLFLLPREKQETSLQTTLEQWHNGFNKAILITGDALCGKTTFINSLAQTHFIKNSVVLECNSTITYRGRKFTTSLDLEAALEQIKKAIDSNRTLLIIDSLELWRDEKHTLLKNVRALINFIENESDEVLVVVTTTPQMQEHLDNRVHFSAVFTNKLSLNKAAFSEIYKAIVVRHGASHKELIGMDNESLSPVAIEKEVLKLAKTYDYNIGEVLQAWTYGTTLLADNKVLYEHINIPFGDFFSSEELIILKYVLLYKSVTELLTKNFVGARYESHYKSALKRLINTKILLRGDSGALHLNPVIQKDVKQLLIYKGTLN